MIVSITLFCLIVIPSESRFPLFHQRDLRFGIMV